MTVQELRSLLERVEAHGGPVEQYRLESPVWTISPGISAHDGNGFALPIRDHLVGVLKRDLIERGYKRFYCEYRDGKWHAAIALRTPPPYDRWDFKGSPGDSELEALLKAWIAAAEAEGWTT